MTDEELKNASDVNAEVGSYGFDLFKEGVKFGRKNLDEATIDKILEAFCNYHQITPDVQPQWNGPAVRKVILDILRR